MPALLFPSDDVLRLALTSGAIPPAVASAPVAAGFDDAGRVWADAPAGIDHAGLASLQRLGARVLGPAGPPSRTYTCWHQLLPLRPTAVGNSGPVLIELPNDRAGPVIARLGRIAHGPVSPRFLSESEPSGRVLVRLPALTPAVADWFADEGIAAYTQCGKGVWVRAGWAHPTADAIRPPAGTVVVIDPNCEWRHVPDEPFSYPPVEYPLGRRSWSGHAVTGPQIPRIPVRFTLRPVRDPRSEEVWLVDGREAFETFLRGADGRALHGLRVAVVTDAPGRHRFVVRPIKDRPFPPLIPGTGYAAHAGFPGLLVPTSHTLSPAIRRDRLITELGLAEGGLVWVEPGAAGGFALHRAPHLKSRPASEMVEYTVPPAHRLDPAWGTVNSLAFEAVSPVIDPDPPEAARSSTDRSRPTGEGWLSRSLGRLSKSLRRDRTSRPTFPHPSPPAPAKARDDRVARTPAETVLPTTSELAARWGELQNRLVHDLPRLPANERATLWAETADLAAAGGRFADAGLSWASAIWESADPPPAWFDAWLRAELRLAKVDHDADHLGEWLALTTRRVPPRLVAAYLAWCGSRPAPPSDLPVRLTRLVAILEDRADKLPIRAGWLARVGAAGLADGDPLGLARWRDAAFRRLAEAGPTLDLDAPAFVRFHGRPGGDRFHAARDWLLRMREPAHRLLARQASPRRLQWFGLDPETDATAGYLDLMFAWGASRLGERNTGRDWEEAAAGVLARPPGAGDAGVHSVLLAAFRHRIRDAQQGRPDRPGLPADVRPAYHQLADFQRYAVDKLRRASSILEPIDRAHPYRGKDAAELLGDDALGRRLRHLFDSPAGDELDREVRSLLTLTATEHAPDTLPRIVLTAVLVAPRLSHDVALEVLGRVPAVVRIAPESVWADRGNQHPRRVVLEDYLGSFLDAATHAACVFGRPEVVRDLARYLTGPTAPPAPTLQAAVGPIAGRFFRALRRLGLTAEAEAVLDRIGPAGDDPASRVGFAVGRLAAGNEDAATRLLDEARERLFAVGFGPPRVKSRLAVAYAVALGHAPPRMAMGRLEEMLLRLDSVWTPGAANRYFTVSVLELIDAIVRSVVSDDFALGPVVRGWLDDAEFGTRRRIARDLDAVLAAAGLGAATDVPAVVARR